MTLTIDLSDELAAQAHSVAAARGLGIEEFAADALVTAVAADSKFRKTEPTTGQLIAEEHPTRRFRQLATDLAVALPANRLPLSDYAVSRSGIYEGEESRF